MKSKKSINAIYAGLAMILGVFIAGELFGADMMRKSKDTLSHSSGHTLLYAVKYFRHSPGTR